MIACEVCGATERVRCCPVMTGDTFGECRRPVCSALPSESRLPDECVACLTNQCRVFGGALPVE